MPDQACSSKQKFMDMPIFYACEYNMLPYDKNRYYFDFFMVITFKILY
jgi:hypothetical protein